MTSMESVCRNFFAGENRAGSVILGTLLILIPIVNFIPLGFQFRTVERLRRGEPISGELPDWGDLRGLFIDGIRMLVLFLIAGGIPLAVGFALTWVLQQFLGTFWFSWVALIPGSLGLFVALPLFGAALYQFMETGEIRNLWPADKILGLIWVARYWLILPTLSFLGLCLVASPILPAALFVGILLLLQYYFILFHTLETKD